jgi:hypothetical protein
VRAADVPQPPERLMDTGLYEAGRPGVVDAGNRPFSPQYPLWSDGAVKRRWVHLPPGTTIDAAPAGEWEFPVGTRFWKEFDAVARSLVGRATTWQVPGAPDGSTAVVHPTAPERSALLARMQSRRPSSQMPPLGTVVRDQVALDAISEWIATDLAGTTPAADVVRSARR